MKQSNRLQWLKRERERYTCTHWFSRVIMLRQWMLIIFPLSINHLRHHRANLCTCSHSFASIATQINCWTHLIVLRVHLAASKECDVCIYFFFFSFVVSLSFSPAITTIRSHFAFLLSLLHPLLIQLTRLTQLSASHGSYSVIHASPSI